MRSVRPSLRARAQILCTPPVPVRRDQTDVQAGAFEPMHGRKQRERSLLSPSLPQMPK
jgi:hypothetical protein